MAKLAKFRRDSRFLDTGEWVRIGEEYDDLEILTRGFTDAYTDHRNAALRKASLKYRSDASKITTAETREITIDCLVADCIIDVRNLIDDDGNAVSVADFATMIRNPDYSDLYLATIGACALAGRARADDNKDAIKN